MRNLALVFAHKWFNPGEIAVRLNRGVLSRAY